MYKLLNTFSQDWGPMQIIQLFKELPEMLHLSVFFDNLLYAITLKHAEYPSQMKI